MRQGPARALGSTLTPIGARASRRRFLAQSAGAAALLAAYKSAGKSATAPAASSGANLDESSLTPQRGGAFQTVGFRQLEHLNPWKVVPPNAPFYFQGSVYDALLHYDAKPFQDYRETFKLVDSLAERWELPENTTYIFHLRRGVVWHDGAPFTAADVKWAFEYMAEPANAVAAGTTLHPIQTITLPDDYTLQVKLKAPQAAFLYGLAGSQAPLILPRHVYERGQQFEKVAVGTGPFKVDSYEVQTGISYLANKQYWKAGKPYLDKFRLLAPTDEAGRLAAFTAGQNDVLHLTNKRQLDALVPLVKNPKLWTFIDEITPDMFMRLDKPPFSDKRIRQAVQAAIDRRALLKQLHGGEGLINPPGINAVAKGWALPQVELDKLPGWRQPKDLDIQEAKQLLAQAGYSNGGLSFTLAIDQSLDTAVADATVIAAQLRTLGITVNIQPLEQGVYAKNRLAGDYQAIIDVTGVSNPENNGRWQQYFHTGGFYNKMPVNDPEADRLIDAQAQEFDEVMRKALCLDFERLLAKEVYMIPLTADPRYFVGQSYVHGWADLMALNVNNMDWGQTWFDQATAPKGR